MTIGVLVFSRMSSSRLPGKAMREFGGMPLVERVMRRAHGSGLPVALATSLSPDDDVLVGVAHSIKCPVVRGSLDDVLSRAADAVAQLEWNAFFRLCGDRPFFDFDEMKALSRLYRGESAPNQHDLITTNSVRLPRGLSTELVSARAIASVAQRADLRAEHREHLTSYIYERQDAFRILWHRSEHETDDRPHLAVDTGHDFETLARVCAADSDVFIATARAVDIVRQDQARMAL